MGRRGQHQWREPGPLQQQQVLQRAPRGRFPRCKNHLADSLLEFRPFSAMVQDQKHSQSEDKWGKLYGPLGHWCPGKYHHAKVCKQSFTVGRANYWPHRFQSCLCGARHCIHKTIGLHRDLGSGRWSSGLWQGSDSPSNPRPFLFRGPNLSHPGNTHHWPSS